MIAQAKALLDSAILPYKLLQTFFPSNTLWDTQSFISVFSLSYVSLTTFSHLRIV